MGHRGKMIYAPRQFVEQLERLQKLEGIQSRSEALRKFANYAQIGRETKVVDSINFVLPRKNDLKRLFEM